jgi:phosphomevalonate kinase
LSYRIYILIINASILAQGKIGSGFDIAAAVYGSVGYNRFNPQGLSDIPQKLTPSLVQELVADSNIWNQKISPIRLPAPLNIMMGDVCGGSSSVSMAQAVIAWRSGGFSAADKIWEALSTCNTDIYQAFRDLEGLERFRAQEFQEVIAKCSRQTSFEWDSSSSLVKHLLLIKSLFRTARSLLKGMGQNAGVDIEPEVQTTLADATDALPGVLCAGVPGAGGVDAIFCIVLSNSSRDTVEKLWSTWVEMRVCPLMLEADNGISCGVRFEDSDDDYRNKDSVNYQKFT